MVTALEIKNFTQGEFYQSLFDRLQTRLPIVHFSEDDMQMYNIFAKMINNSTLSLHELININDQESLLKYGKARVLNEINTNEDFLEGYEAGQDDIPETISYSYSKLILLQMMLEYFYLKNNKKEEFLIFLKKQKIPSPKKFLNELLFIFEKSKNE